MEKQCDFTRGGDATGVADFEFELTIGVTEPAKAVNFVLDRPGSEQVTGGLQQRTDGNARPGQDWSVKLKLGAGSYTPTFTVTLPDGRSKAHTFKAFEIKAP